MMRPRSPFPTAGLFLLLVLLPLPLLAGKMNQWQHRDTNIPRNHLTTGYAFPDGEVKAFGYVGSAITYKTLGGFTDVQFRIGGTSDWMIRFYFSPEYPNFGMGIAGSEVIKTENRGTTYTQATHPDDTVQLCGLDTNAEACMLNGIFGGADGKVYKTTDGGNLWASFNVGVAEKIREIAMKGTSIGWALTETGRVLFTKDGGDSWEESVLPPPPGAFTSMTYNIDLRYDFQTYGEPLAFEAVTDTAIVVVGDGGAIYWSSDAGRTFQSQTSGITSDLNRVSAGTATQAIAVGDDGVILYTKDAGQNWNPANSGTTLPLLCVTHSSADTAYAVGFYGTFLCTTDGGMTWTDSNPGNREILWAVRHADANTAYAVGGAKRIVKTSDGGATWTEQSSGDAFEQLNDVCVIDANTAVAVGMLGLVLRTTNGGTDWNTATSGTTTNLWGVHFIDTNTGFAAGTNDLYKTTDGGANWAPMNSGAGNYQDVHFVDAQNGVAVGSSGLIRRTTDGGTTWNNRTSGSFFTLRSVTFTDANTGFVGGSFSAILKTTDGGDTWNPAGSPTTQSVYDIYFIDAMNGYASGINFASTTGLLGSLLKTVDGGDTWVEISDQTSTANVIYGVCFPDTAHGTIVGDGGSILTFNQDVTAVAITAFDAAYNGRHVELSWEIGAADDLRGFHVYRAAADDDPLTRLNEAMIDPSNGYGWADHDIEPGRAYRYQLGAVDRDGEFFSPVVTVEIPEQSLELFQNHPNPFNPTTEITFRMPESAPVELIVYDIRGAVVRRLLRENRRFGTHSVTWNGRNEAGESVGTGVYFYRLTVGKLSISRKAVLLK